MIIRTFPEEESFVPKYLYIENQPRVPPKTMNQGEEYITPDEESDSNRGVVIIEII